MCDPVTATLVAVSAGQQVMSHVATNEMAEAQTRAINEGLRLQQEQEADAAGAEQSERAREARRERSRALVAAAEAGIGGEAVLSQLRDSVFQAGFDIARTESNKDRNIDAARRRAQTQVDSIQTSSLLDLGLGIGSSVAQGVLAGRGAKRTTRTRTPTAKANPSRLSSIAADHGY